MSMVFGYRGDLDLISQDPLLCAGVHRSTAASDPVPAAQGGGREGPAGAVQPQQQAAGVGRSGEGATFCPLPLTSAPLRRSPGAPAPPATAFV